MPKEKDNSFFRKAFQTKTGNPLAKNQVGLLGFEPRQTESKSVVLPLHHNP